jgi:hypothetical protein
MKLLLIACIVDTGQSIHGFCIVHKFKGFCLRKLSRKQVLMGCWKKKQTIYFQTFYIAI